MTVIPQTPFSVNRSIFAACASEAIEAGYSPIPRLGKSKTDDPNGAKAPAIKNWSQFCDKQASPDNIRRWNRSFPDAQLCLAMGYAGVVAIDRDTEDAAINAAIDSVVGKSTVAKRGSKGRTDFYRVVGAMPASRKFKDTNKQNIVEILAHGCQTVIPPSLHPVSGKPYVWLSESSIFDTIPDELPTITAAQIEKLEQVLSPWLYKSPSVDWTQTGEATQALADLTELDRKRQQGAASAAMRSESASLSAKAKPGRSDAAFSAALKLGVFAENGFLATSEIRAALYAACDQNGLVKDNGEKDVKKTISNGLKAAKGKQLKPLKDRPRTQAKQAKTSRTVYGDSPCIVWPEVSKDGEIVARSQLNIGAFLASVGVTFSHNAFSSRNIITRNGQSETLDDQHLRGLWLEADSLGLKTQQKYFSEVVFNLCFSSRFNPVCEFLDGLKWDGRPRLNKWLSTYLGARSSKVIDAQGAIHLIAAVRRARNPGVKYDTMLVLEGPQGGGKSTAIRRLAGDDWFCDSLNIGEDAKTVLEQTADAWIVELAELAGIGKRDVESVKSFLSRQKDSARLSYDRCNTQRGRKFICFATTNSSDYLIDQTGNRRFWPVKVGEIDLEAIERDRAQLWAEAAHREAAGESITLDKDLWSAAAEEQAARVQVDPWQETLESAIGDRCGKVAVNDIWQRLGVDSKSQNPAMGKRIADIMRRLGFEKDRQRNQAKDGQRVHCYSKPGGDGWFCL